MKKLLLIVTLTFALVLTGCLPENTSTVDDNTVRTALSEEELADLIESLIPEQNVDTTYDLSSFQTAVEDMVEGARKGVVGISAFNDVSGGTGSGVIYKKEGNLHYVVTNHHVIEGATDISVIYEENGLLFEIKDDFIVLLGSDPTTDLAVLTFNSTEDFAVIPIADSYEVVLGEFVFAIGNPLGFDYYGTVTMGVISGLSRYVNNPNDDFDATLLQHDAAISPGNSGGALLNLNGELIGINNMKIVDQDVSNIGFAIPSNTVKRIVADLEDDGVITRPYLGISTFAQVNICGTTVGVCVDVIEGGAADNAGLETGDTIIGYKTLDMNEYMVINNFNDLKEAILNSKVGDTVVIKYIRDGEEKESLETVLGVHPDD